MSYSSMWGAEFGRETAYVAKVGHGKFNHCFGGANWKVIDRNSVHGGPALLLTLDLNDPRLRKFANAKIKELPLCTYISCNIWEEEQLYLIDPERKEINLIRRTIVDNNKVTQSDVSHQLPLRELVLAESESPLNESLYWEQCDTLVGGDDFIRIVEPIWTQDPEEHKCECGKDMLFTACIGYEACENPAGIVDGEPFFLGEAVLYFFFCRECLIVKVTAQST